MRHRGTLITSILVILTGSEAFCLPRFAAKVEQKCNLCHISPSGRGMRNTFGSQFYAQTQLAVHTVPLDSIKNINPMVSENICLGTDMRTLYIYNKEGKQSSFFQMEGNFYLDAQVGDNFSVTLSKGLYSGFDVYGMAYILPAHGYVRVGKFQPSYGWAFADHSSFVRERMLWQPNYTDTGIEAGLYPFGVSANFGFFNGTAGTLDENVGKALAARLEFRKHISKIGVGVGGSFWRNDRPAGAINMYGPFYYLNALGARLIHLGEVDWLNDQGSDLTTFATTQSLAFMVSQGIWLEAAYDFQDPDVDLKNGVVTRYSFAVDYFPIGFFELEPSLRYYDDDFAPKTKYTVFYNQFHFFF